MNPMLQRHCAKFIYIVPDGLKELMSDISREVIRAQPMQVYTFIADYLDALMITRENARIAARLVDSICEIAETTVELLIRTGLSRDAANEIVAVIQTAFRDYLERKKKFAHSKEVPGEADEESMVPSIMQQVSVPTEKLNEVATVVQTAWRKFKERQEREKKMLFGMVDWRIAARSAIMLYRKTGVTMYEANRAATLIKAAYKGYYTRRIMKRLLHMGLDEESTTPIESTAEEHTEGLSQMGEVDDYLYQMYSVGESGGSDDSLEMDDESEPSPGREDKHHAAHRKPKAEKKHPSAKPGPTSSSAAAAAAQKKDRSSLKTAESGKSRSKQPIDEHDELLMAEELPPTEEAYSQGRESLAGEGPAGALEEESREDQPPPPNTEQDVTSERIEVDEISPDEGGEVPPAEVDTAEPEPQPEAESAPTEEVPAETEPAVETEAAADTEPEPAPETETEPAEAPEAEAAPAPAIEAEGDE